MKKTGFTLIEMLVVIAIISILASMLMPGLTRAKEEGRRANCINNLRQFSACIEIYRNTYEDEFPPYLSKLYDMNYFDDLNLLLCMSDRTRGREGGRPSWYPEDQQFESADLDGPDLDELTDTNSVPSSYLYEFNGYPCEWAETAVTDPAEWADIDYNGDGRLQWREVNLVMIAGLGGVAGYGGRVPVVRCFYHLRPDCSNGEKPTLDLLLK